MLDRLDFTANHLAERQPWCVAKTPENCTCARRSDDMEAIVLAGTNLNLAFNKNQRGLSRGVRQPISTPSRLECRNRMRNHSR